MNSNLKDQILNACYYLNDNTKQVKLAEYEKKCNVILLKIFYIKKIKSLCDDVLNIIIEYLFNDIVYVCQQIKKISLIECLNSIVISRHRAVDIDLNNIDPLMVSVLTYEYKMFIDTHHLSYFSLLDKNHIDSLSRLVHYDNSPSIYVLKDFYFHSEICAKCGNFWIFNLESDYRELDYSSTHLACKCKELLKYEITDITYILEVDDREKFYPYSDEHYDQTNISTTTVSNSIYANNHFKNKSKIINWYTYSRPHPHERYFDTWDDVWDDDVISGYDSY